MIGDERTIANGAKPYQMPPWVYRPIVSFAAAPRPRRFSEEVEP
jgi:hypothetical protein